MGSAAICMVYRVILASPCLPVDTCLRSLQLWSRECSYRYDREGNRRYTVRFILVLLVLKDSILGSHDCFMRPLNRHSNRGILMRTSSTALEG